LTQICTDFKTGEPDETTDEVQAGTTLAGRHEIKKESALICANLRLKMGPQKRANRRLTQICTDLKTRELDETTDEVQAGTTLAGRHEIEKRICVNLRQSAVKNGTAEEGEPQIDAD